MQTVQIAHKRMLTVCRDGTDAMFASFNNTWNAFGCGFVQCSSPLPQNLRTMKSGLREQHQGGNIKSFMNKIVGDNQLSSRMVYWRTNKNKPRSHHTFIFNIKVQNKNAYTISVDKLKLNWKFGTQPTS